MLEFIESVGYKVDSNGQKRKMALAKCLICGNIKECREDNLKRYKSCGCLKFKNLNKITHGMSKDPLYKRWHTIRQRCFNPNTPTYEHYGGRGIKMCDEWNDNFESFYEWSINSGYKKELTLDRIDNNGNYEPGNCRWTTMKEQTNNRRVNVIVEYAGEKMTLREASRKSGFNHKALETRYRRGYRGDDLFQDLKEHTAGSMNGNSKLTENQVKQIKKLLHEGLSQADIARLFEVSRYCIHHIKIGKTWNHVKIDDTEVNE